MSALKRDFPAVRDIYIGYFDENNTPHFNLDSYEDDFLDKLQNTIQVMLLDRNDNFHQFLQGMSKKNNQG